MLALAMIHGAGGASGVRDSLLRSTSISNNPKVLPPISILVQERLHYIQYKSPSLFQGENLI